MANSKKKQADSKFGPENTLHIYTRVSTAAQAEKGTSLKSQFDLGKRRAKELGFKPHHWDEGGKSSHHEDMAQREKLFALFNAIRNGEVKHLWVYDQSRISRNDQVASVFRYECNKQGVRLYTKDGEFDLSNPQDQLLKSLLDSLSVFENAQRAERTRMGKLHRVKAGLWHGGPPPFGYRLVDKKLAIEPSEAKLVKNIFKSVHKKVSIRDIKVDLDSSGVRPRRGGTWSMGSIQAMLNNTHYKGYYTFKDEKSGHTETVLCPNIVDVDLWETIHHARMEENSRRSQKNATHKRSYLLRDIMWCWHCKRPISGRQRSSKNEAHYYCPYKENDWKKNGGSETPWKRHENCGLNRALNIPQTDALVWEYVKGIHQKSHRLREDFKKAILKEKGYGKEQDIEEVKKTEERIKRLLAELQQANRAIGTLEANRLRGRHQGEESYKTTLGLLSADKQDLERRLATERLKLKGQSDNKKWFDWLRVFGEELSAKDNLNDEQKKAYISGLVDRIDVKFLSESREHELHIHFKLPIVEDKFKWVDYKKRTYKLGKGETEGILTIAKKDGRG